MKTRSITALLAVLFISAHPAAEAVERVDEVELPGIETYLNPVVVDPAGEFAYAASGIATLDEGADDMVRGLIVKFDLDTFERVDSIYIDWNYTDGFRFFNTGFIDPEGRFAYFANGLVTPAQIVKIDLETFELVDSLHTSFQEKDYISSIVDPQGEFAYLGTANGRLVKVDLNTFERADGLLFDDDRVRSLVIDPAGEFMYIGTEEIEREGMPPRPGKIFKMDLATFETVDWFELDGLNAYAAAMDSSGEVAWFRVDGQLLSVDLTTFEPVGTTPIGNFFNPLARPYSLRAAPGGQFLYIRDSDRISKFDLDTMEKTDSIGGLTRFYTVDPTREAIYTPTEEGLVKVDSASFEQVDLAETDDGFVRVQSGAVDPAGNFGYFGGNTEPYIARVVKVDLESMEMVDSITLDDRRTTVRTALVDPAGEFGYFTRRSNEVHKLNLTTFEWEGYVEFEGLSGVLTAAMAPDGGYAYFGTGFDPPTVARLDLETFQPAGTIELNSDEGLLLSSAIDPAGRYAYFGAGFSGRKIIKIDLETFTRVGALQFEEQSINSAAIDPAGEYGYFGLADKLIKVDLATFERVDTINGLSAELMMDPSGRYLFRHNGGRPPRISRVDLETFTNAETVRMTGREGTLAGASIGPEGKYLWFGTADNDREPARVVRVALLRSAQMQHSAVAINGDAPEPFAYSMAGDVIDYGIAVDSDGNVTLRGVTVSEPQFDALNCEPAAPATLAPGDSMVCSGSYTVTQADLDAGSFSTLATTGIDKTDPLNAETTVMAAQNPVIALTGSIIDGDGYQAVGETISYSMTATNSGNVTLSDVAINDPDGVFSNCDALPDGVLAPDESTSCQGSHTVTQQDLDAGHFSIATTASATDPGANPVEGSGSAMAAAAQTATLGLDKQVTGGNPYSAVGDTVDYSLAATNTGNVTLSNVGFSDPDAVLGDCNPAPPATLAPGETLTCQAGYTVTQADLDAGSFTNTAEATGTAPDTNAVGAVDSATASGVQNPILGLVKEADVESFFSAGDVIDYTITATNGGNVSLTGLTIIDPLIDALVCSPETPAQIAPGGQLVCTGSHTATEADVTAGAIINTASADSEQTDPVEATATVELELVAEISLNPVSIDFGPVPINEAGGQQVLNVDNVGNGEARIESISEPPAPFTLAGGSCLPAPTMVAAGESCTILVAFAPAEIAHFDGGFEIVSDAPSSPDAVGLTGTGMVVAIPVPIGGPAASAILVLLFGLTGGLVLLYKFR